MLIIQTSIRIETAKAITETLPPRSGKPPWSESRNSSSEAILDRHSRRDVTRNRNTQIPHPKPYTLNPQPLNPNKSPNMGCKYSYLTYPI